MSTITRITIANYERKIAAGEFETGMSRRRVELIDGELRDMSPIGPIHGWIVNQLARWSIVNTSIDRVEVLIQCPISLPEQEALPEPDIAWAKPGDYRACRPGSHDLLLVIEVADSSLAYDRGEKAEHYAAGGIAEYWVVNIPDRCVEVLRDPVAGRYKIHQIFTVADTVSPLAFPQVFLAVADLFPDEE